MCASTPPCPEAQPCLTAHGLANADGMPKYWSVPSAAWRAAPRSGPSSRARRAAGSARM
ncbi:hypothetical protein LWP59_21215 [Amycolatopsis acidiphila]|uniref:hypothetical protein n=1 Tax=Amycolatopsis acidiphila TaxID=715473 RepID=UPI001643A6AD|nr:hypothetical protein [Amycolatopsis acidiphila]UIJ56703.1 hypothetical protein LWP59_21215 [Amycolatopsis acidiphila]